VFVNCSRDNIEGLKFGFGYLIVPSGKAQPCSVPDDVFIENHYQGMRQGIAFLYIGITFKKQFNRFRHFLKNVKEKVMMDFGVFAVAFNIGKLFNKSIKNTQNVQNTQKSAVSIHTLVVFIICVPKSDSHLPERYFSSLNFNLAA
jgi:hypothetical protein